MYSTCVPEHHLFGVLSLVLLPVAATRALSGAELRLRSDITKPSFG